MPMAQWQMKPAQRTTEIGFRGLPSGRSSRTSVRIGQYNKTSHKCSTSAHIEQVYVVYEQWRIGPTHPPTTFPL